jgi:hypothetical protein
MKEKHEEKMGDEISNKLQTGPTNDYDFMEKRRKRDTSRFIFYRCSRRIQ